MRVGRGITYSPPVQVYPIPGHVSDGPPEPCGRWSGRAYPESGKGPDNSLVENKHPESPHPDPLAILSSLSSPSLHLSHHTPLLISLSLSHITGHSSGREEDPPGARGVGPPPSHSTVGGREVAAAALRRCLALGSLLQQPPPPPVAAVSPQLWCCDGRTLKQRRVAPRRWWGTEEGSVEVSGSDRSLPKGSASEHPVVPVHLGWSFPWGCWVLGCPASVKMATESGRLDYWRKFLGSANSDIFDVIENAILVAATDYPKEFRSRRDRIAERLFSCQLPRCSGCERVKEEAVQEEEGEFVVGEGRGEGAVGGAVEKESKVNSCVSEREVDANRVASNYSYDEAEALTEEIEEEGQMFGEVLRIKEILSNKEDESEAVLYESLRRLQLIVVSVDVLKVAMKLLLLSGKLDVHIVGRNVATEIGKAVNPLRKHRSKEIRHLVRTLLDGWKAMVDQWMNATAPPTESTPESMNPSVADNGEGLPSPPMDEGALFATQTAMELSQFFDGMDDDGNMQTNDEFGKCQERGRRSSMENRSNAMRKQQVSNQSVISEDDSQMRKQEVLKKQAKQPEVINKRSNLQKFFCIPQKPQDDLNKQCREPEGHNRQNRQSGSNAAAGPVRPQKTMFMENRFDNNTRFQQQKEAAGIQKKPLTGLQDTPKSSGEISVRDKLEAAKRKLQERYQQAEDAKRQRTVQVMELQDIPKQGPNNRQPFTKAGNNNRYWANGRC
ncbi:hypothetical protein Taro_047661 [Colocasia esculenta]|uniref:TFIIS N-terminal domain-containing protein n=1 Tax=Colocasia esculenta TaxID=4460 RepID=A0A843X1F0_COLES|nr:hypothetical protein [Colocasia esculenta]